MIQDAAVKLDLQNREISELDKLINETTSTGDTKGSKRTIDFYSTFSDLDNDRGYTGSNENYDPKLAEINKFSENHLGYPVWKMRRPLPHTSPSTVTPEHATDRIQVTEGSNFIGVLDMYNSLSIVLKFEEVWEASLKQLHTG